MKILMINVCCGTGSTGRICTDLAERLEKNGHEVKIAYARDAVADCFQKYAVRIGNDLDVYSHVLRTRLMDEMGYGSHHATISLVKWIEEYNPDIIHLHNIHGYYLNINILFQYLKTCGKKIIWTLHDCWSFTGHCVFFDYYKCDKWKIGCGKCPQKNEYPARMWNDKSKINYINKKELFSNINNMTLVTPSQWLADLVKQSFLGNYVVEVINNGIDTSSFYPCESKIKLKYKCSGKKVILGVASVWDKRKGLGDFIKLSQKIDDSYQIILVGLSKKQLKNLPKNIIGIERTDSVRELAELYSGADYYINPTYEDNYPTTNLEAIACGTPVISYDTGGSGESAILFGTKVEKGDIEAIVKKINCEYVKTSNIDLSIKSMIDKYLEIYEWN